MMNSPKVQLAKAFAYAAHAACGQIRKYTGEPYFMHVHRVAETVAQTDNANEDMICAAYLHDTIEDTKVHLKDISTFFGSDVAVLVLQLTNVSKPEDGNRAFRKELDRSHTAKACPEAKTIKLADIKDNVTSITKYDKGFAKTYLKEKKMLLEFLKEGDPRLWIDVRDIIEDWENGK